MIPLNQLTTIIEQNLPDNPYEKAVELQRLHEFAQTLAKTTLDQYNQEITNILQNRITHHTLCMVTPIRYIREPNIQKLKEQYPKIYETIAYIPAYHAEKILGRPRIFAACKDVDLMRAESFAAVNLGDLKMHLAGDEYPKYTQFRAVPSAPEVRMQGDAP